MLELVDIDLLDIEHHVAKVLVIVLIVNVIVAKALLLQEVRVEQGFMVIISIWVLIGVLNLLIRNRVELVLRGALILKLQVVQSIW